LHRGWTASVREGDWSGEASSSRVARHIERVLHSPFWDTRVVRAAHTRSAGHCSACDVSLDRSMQSCASLKRVIEELVQGSTDRSIIVAALGSEQPTPDKYVYLGLAQFDH
jgi:hypothetical protein